MVYDNDDVCSDGSDCHWDHDDDGLQDGEDPDDEFVLELAVACRCLGG